MLAPSDISLAQTARLDAPSITAQTLPPLLHRDVACIFQRSPEKLFELVQRFGSPLHLVWPHVLRENIEGLRAVLRKHDLHFEMFYGAKANKSQALLQAAVEASVGVDVSSIYELGAALRAGVDGCAICATGPAKTRVFHAALIGAGSLIAIDSREEFDDLEALARETRADSPTRVLLRYRPHASRTSRFGMTVDDLLACLHRLAISRDLFRFEGFHFHLPGYSHQSRVDAIAELMPLVQAARALNLPLRLLDIGGGLPVRYVESARFDAFARAQRPSDYRNGIVPSRFYPYGGRIGAADWLEQLLTSPLMPGLSVEQYLNRQQLTLALEPGRSLADQAALSLFRITRVKSLADDTFVVFAEGSSFSACETWFASEFLVDPILVSCSHGERPGIVPSASPVRAYIAGHSCLDEDVITNRLIHFQSKPQTGDLLVYANTAGYQMDLLENEFHRHPMPKRISARWDDEGRIETFPDQTQGVPEWS
ncbi:MAG TPA: Y4yA family PLP-dependent enzyme [Trinickia sp.]|uniref:Y4yA family PLP-dependent enzyme n=1 Tax=Trinickia sp. TaxID=2571163 RepID=UPI002C962CA2|nr:Y4yA family PLP-dependent enzyme [Trinickia sp.]HTI18034.1 Y4yA family PLP-dependent enzyme [Trinickia sp.]